MSTQASDIADNDEPSTDEEEFVRDTGIVVGPARHEQHDPRVRFIPPSDGEPPWSGTDCGGQVHSASRAP